MNTLFHQVWDLHWAIRLLLLAGVIGGLVWRRRWGFGAVSVLFMALLVLFGDEVRTFTQDWIRPFLLRLWAASGAGVELARSLPSVSRLALVAAGILVAVRWGLGIGYAFLLGAIATGLLWGQDLEDLVNSISGGANRGETLRLVAVLFLASGFAELLGRAGVPLIPFRSRDAHGAGEPPRAPDEPSPALERAGHPLGYILPTAPPFLAAVALAGVPMPLGLLLFAPLAAACAAGWFWADRRLPPLPADVPADAPAPHPAAGRSWIVLLPWAGLPFGSWGVLAGLAAGIALASRGSGLPAREAWGAVWRNCTADLAVLMMGTMAFAYTVTHCGALKDLGPALPSGPGIRMALAFGLPFVLSLASGWPLVGLGLALPLLVPAAQGVAAAPAAVQSPLQGAPAAWALLLAGYAGAMVGSSLPRAPWAASALVTAAALLPGFVFVK